ncbi:PEP-CTERM sorting domain-containing protein [Massilia sp. MB5]|uniref:PEP-CTERM sorting domain-containing protein n=1 Tax=unclassified Massilia TaxID=2609279 RepID=UPI00067BA296|nr:MULTISPECIES: PEP-CTERM sorting domain-containing protein [unclassified Massilia]AKU23726.1 hypothetical protein ACZ75_21995 [Massilia sp. NR 4-1]UMR31337.1 PEP-CTERM sorting domain-containing protein [Massilia sp. MB5]
MHRKAFAAVLVATATLALSSSASAAQSTTAQASLSNLKLGVIDLTPNDGVAAGYQLGSRDTQVAVFSQWLENGQPAGAANRQQFEFPVPVNFNVQHGGLKAQAQLNGSLGNLKSVVTGTPELGWNGHYVAGDASQTVRVLLKAHTALSISGDYSALLSTQNPGYFNLPGQTQLGVSFNSLSMPGLINERFSKGWTLAPGSAGESASGGFSLLASNNTDDDIEASLGFYVGSSVSLAPVPEPTTWLMLGAGMLVLAGRRRFGRS